MRFRRVVQSCACCTSVLCAGLVLFVGVVIHSKAADETHLFTHPERVTLRGYPPDADAMEPFVSRDGRYLFFNSRNEAPVNTDLYYAERIDDLTFQFRGPLEGVNTPALDAVATMDRGGNFYFVSTRSYSTTFSTLYRGKFERGRVTGVELVPGISRAIPGIVNFDVEVSADGDTLYYVESRFVNGSPQGAKLVIAKRKGAVFERLAAGDAILKEVNTEKMQYAACISQDERTLYFTQIRIGIPPYPAIYMATRPDKSSPFGKPLKVAAAEGFVEGPTLSPDEKSLYYHKKEGDRFEVYRVKRR